MKTVHLPLRQLFRGRELFPEIAPEPSVLDRLCPGETGGRGTSFVLERSGENWFLPCEAQRLDADAAVSGVGIAGCGLWGEQRGRLRLEFEDGCRETVLCFPDWYHPMVASELYDRDRARARNCARILFWVPLESGERIYTYYRRIRFSRPRRLRGIVLPDNPLLVIRALSLEAEDGQPLL